MGSSQSVKNKAKIAKKYVSIVASKFKRKIKNCCLCISNAYLSRFSPYTENEGTVVNNDIELDEYKNDEPDFKLINCKLNKKTPSLKNYINDTYIRTTSDTIV